MKLHVDYYRRKTVLIIRHFSIAAMMPQAMIEMSHSLQALQKLQA